MDDRRPLTQAGPATDLAASDFEIARRAGYASASTTRKGLVRGGRDPFGLPRNTLNGSHRHLAFAKAHLTGLTGRAARVLAALVLEVDQNIVKRLPPPFEALRRFVLRRTAHVLCRSPDAAAVVRANGYTGPVSFIGYGVDQNLFHAADTAAAAQAAGPLRIGYVGRLVVEKGLDDALDAMALSSADVRLAIKSEGPHEACLRSRVAQLGLQGKVTFEPWGARTASPSRRLRRSSPTLGSLPQAKGIGYPDGCPRAGSLAEGEVGSTPHSPGREARIRSIGCHQDQDEVSWPQVA